MIRPTAINIVEEARRNSFYRRVIDTGERSQLVVMALRPHEEIGEETHRVVEQRLIIVDGAGTIYLNGFQKSVGPGYAILIPPGTTHNLIAGQRGLQLFTIYAPPNHLDDVLHRTREDAEADTRDQAFGRQVERGEWGRR